MVRRLPEAAQRPVCFCHNINVRSCGFVHLGRSHGPRPRYMISIEMPWEAASAAASDDDDDDDV